MENISEHITYDEATISPTGLRLGIKNDPSPSELSFMKTVASRCFEPLRKWYAKPIKVNSFFRCEELNKAVGGAKNSQHAKGQAIDLSAGSKIENKKLFDWLKNNVEFDQLINEYDFSWVHVSYKAGENRKQILVVI